MRFWMHVLTRLRLVVWLGWSVVGWGVVASGAVACTESASSVKADAGVTATDVTGAVDAGDADAAAGSDALAATDTTPASWPLIALDPAAKAPPKLSMIGVARRVNGVLELHPDMVPYELSVPLFSDYAVKRRALWLPAGTAISYRAKGPLDFPVGSILIKSFLFPEDMSEPTKHLRLIETRVIVRDKTEWKAWPYVWDDDGQDATLKVGGTVKSLPFMDVAGNKRTANYLVPQRNQCLDCHDRKDSGGTFTDIIGPKARYLNREILVDGEAVNQLQRLSDNGWLKGMPALGLIDQAFSAEKVAQVGVAQLGKAELNAAARDYLDINCAHCHSPNGVEGRTSQLYLNFDNEDAFLMGVCKAPSSAGKGGFGRSYDIVPGQPDQSILVYRLQTTELGAMMPDIGRSLVHTEGLALVRRWILEMAPVKCDR